MSALQQILFASAGGASGTFALDSIGITPAAAYSLRRLRTAYTGYAIRVRRPSDNATLEVGFLGTGELDTSSLTTFIGSGTGSVSIWYDQSGNGLNASNATEALQPRIINSGTLVTLNGYPAVSFIAQELSFTNTAVLRTDWTSYVAFSTVQPQLGGAASLWYQMKGLLYSEQTGVVNDFGIGNFGNRFTLGAGASGGSDNAVSGTTDIRTGVPIVGVTTRTSSTGAVALWVNGNADATGTLATGDRSASTTALIGGDSVNAIIAEAVVFASVQGSTDRGTIQTDQMTRFGAVYPVPDLGQTWNPNDKGTSVALSNGNLTVTNSSSTSTKVRSTYPKSSGKWYLEVHIDTRAVAGSQNPMLGVMNGAASLAGDVGDSANGWGWLSGSGYYHNSTVTGSSPTYGAGVVAMIALDMDNGKLYFGKDGTWNNSGNPATSTAPAYTGISGLIYAAQSVGSSSTDVTTARFAAASQTYSPPSGFSAWG